MGKDIVTSLVSTEDKIRFLRDVDLFINIPEHLLYKVALMLQEVAIAAEEQIITEGEQGACMFLVYEGTMRVHKEDHTLAEIPAKSVFGELSLLTKAPRSASITAIEPSILLRLEQSDFFYTLGNSPELSQGLLRILIERLNNQSEATLTSLKKREEQLTKLVEERTQQLQEEKKKIEEAVEEIQIKNMYLTKANEKIRAQKDEIESKNRHITQSITYASRIQNAILGEPKHIIKHMHRFAGDAFVYFKPKDIVSGDFYWYTHTEDKTIVVVADCTGHGVPGAFMTMMGSALLNEIVNEKRIFDPAKILYELDKKVTEATSDDEQNHTVNDGMDMSVLVLDQQEDWVHFAGAKSHLFHVTDPILNCCELINGNRYPIGSQQYVGGKRFTTQHIRKVKGDILYLFTDGFQDQAGGERREDNQWGRKYMSRKFREFLLDHARLPMLEQQLALEKELCNWKKDFGQTDDILVLGLKI